MAGWAWYVPFLHPKDRALTEFFRLSVSASTSWMKVRVNCVFDRHGTGHGVGHFLNVHEGMCAMIDVKGRN
jgi:hypothetical protein